MSLEFLPVGVACNLGCDYCYETSLRDNKDNRTRYNKEVVLAKMDNATDYWTLFGGEPLLLPIKEIDELFARAYAKHGRTGIQTNGTLITDAHIEMFLKYQTYVGISVDGPGELNDSRTAGTPEATRKLTVRSHEAIEKLAKISRERNIYHIMPSLIVTIHAGNASPERWERMKEWFFHLDEIGVRYVNLHTLEMDAEASKWFLPMEQLTAALHDLWNTLPKFKNLKFPNFKEYLSLIQGNDSEAMCTWHACDPWNTAAVQGLTGEGEPAICGRTNKEGVEWLPAEGFGQQSKHAIDEFIGNRSHERQMSLYVTPQEYGGCKDCRFWMQCMGHCPGTGESTEAHGQGDWRLRTSHCAHFIDMFTEAEKRVVAVGQVPISLHPKRKQFEERMYELWAQGLEPSMSGVIREAAGEKVEWNRDRTQHGDHYDYGTTGAGAITKHGDKPHGDEHGDHLDANFIEHGDTPHGDSHSDHLDVNKTEHSDTPHGDEHGDHLDMAMVKGS